MVKLAVVAAGGRVGKRVVDEAVRQGLEVTAFARRPIETNASALVVKDLFDLTAADLAGFDAVVDAFGTFDPQTVHLHAQASMHLADILSGTQTRLLVVGGAGTLYVDPEHTQMLLQTADFPAQLLPVATAQANSLAKLRQRSDVRWTFITPAPLLQLDGERTGTYQLGGEEMIFNAAGESVVSYDDYALAVVDEAVNAAHVNERICVCSK